MASSYYSADLTAVAGAGRNLQDVSSTIRGGSQFAAAVGAEPYPQITSALADFHDQWDNAVGKLVNSIGSLGQTTTQVGEFMRAHDQALADAWAGSTPNATSSGG